MVKNASSLQALGRRDLNTGERSRRPKPARSGLEGRQRRSSLGMELHRRPRRKATMILVYTA
jgi:hypothetical protein